MEEKSSLSKTFSFRNFRNNCLTIIFDSYQVNKYSEIVLEMGQLMNIVHSDQCKIDFREKIEIPY